MQRRTHNVCGCHTNSGAAPVPAGFGCHGQRAATDRCCAHVGRGWTTVPEGVQLEADCFLRSPTLHVGVSRGVAEPMGLGSSCVEKRLSAYHLLAAGGLNSWMG